MSAPLGGKHRERKRLVRCKHRRYASFWSHDSDELIIRCSVCGGEMRISALELRGMRTPCAFALERIPPTIARKASDG